MKFTYTYSCNQCAMSVSLTYDGSISVEAWQKELKEAKKLWRKDHGEHKRGI